MERKPLGKAAQLNMRVPESLLPAVKRRATAEGILYTRFIRRLMEQAVSRPYKPRLDDPSSMTAAERVAEHK